MLTHWVRDRSRASPGLDRFVDVTKPHFTGRDAVLGSIRQIYHYSAEVARQDTAVSELFKVGSMQPQTPRMVAFAQSRASAAVSASSQWPRMNWVMTCATRRSASTIGRCGACMSGAIAKPTALAWSIYAR